MAHSLDVQAFTLTSMSIYVVESYSIERVNLLLGRKLARAESEPLLNKSMQMGIGTIQRQVILVKPLDCVEFTPIKRQGPCPIPIEGIPERDVRMAGGVAHCRGGGHQNRGVMREAGVNAQLLHDLAFDGLSGVFVWLHVPTCWQPELSVDVIDEEEVIAIDEDKVRDQVFGWCRGLLNSIDGVALVDPLEHVLLRLRLQWIER